MRALAAALFGMALSAAAGPASADAAREQGAAALEAQDFDRAARLLERAVEEAPGDAAAHHLLGQALAAQARAGSMITKMRLAGRIGEHFERAVAIAPGDVAYRESLLEYYVQAPAAFGGGLDKARAQAAEIAKRDRARGLLATGRIAEQDGDTEAALGAYRDALAANPRDARAAVRTAVYLQELERWPAAFATLDAFLAANPAAAPVWYQLGRTAVLSNSRHADGERAFRRYLSMPRGADDPPPAAAHWRLGLLYEQTGRRDDARGAYEEALRLDPGHADAAAALRKLD